MLWIRKESEKECDFCFWLIRIVGCSLLFVGDVSLINDFLFLSGPNMCKI